MSDSTIAHPLDAALDDFVARYQATFPELHEPFDREWRSPCELGEPYTADDGAALIRWQPLRRSGFESPDAIGDFAALERALEFDIHPDVKRYYARYWSGGLEATASDGHVSLLFLWNPADAERLVENLIGHALAKRQARAGFSVFFACTEADSELFLSIDNDSGAVLLEKPGYKPIRTVADSAAAFIATLEPASPALHPERFGRVDF
jgi:SecY interacting protein Syd